MPTTLLDQRNGVGVLLASLVGSAAMAQEVKVPDLLASPQSAVVCQSRPGPGLSGVLLVEIAESASVGFPSGRNITMHFDSTGKALNLLLLAPPLTVEAERDFDAILVNFEDPVRGLRSRAPPISSKAGASADLAQGRSLTQAELKQAQELARWVWKHRCRGLSGDPQ